MERGSRRCISDAALPAAGIRKYVQIYAKISKKMLPSSSSPRPRRSGNTSHSGTPPSSELPEVSDVPCYTCRRRHVRCDRMLPTCAKCRKKGVECLGYTKPLRWADGVAVRGKLKGKSKPVVDNNVVSLAQGHARHQTDTALREAAHMGLHSTDNCCNDVVADESRFLELMAYHNSTICAERYSPQHPSPIDAVDRNIAQISPEIVQRLPRNIVNCILGIAAVHMASHNPGNSALERLALETKVNVFQSHNRLLQAPRHQFDHQPDVIICSGLLIFAMDLFEHGMSRWVVHILGCMNVISSLGGIENLSLFYPHLHVPFFYISHFETTWLVLSHVPVTRPKQVSRGALEMLCHAPNIQGKVFNPCPVPLTLAMWDVGACAQSIIGSGTPINLKDMHKRERVLLDVLSFQPQEASRMIKDEHIHNPQVSKLTMESWDMVHAAWKAATTILVLRYLYFGRHHLIPHARGRQSPSSSFSSRPSSMLARQEESSTYFRSTVGFEYDMNDLVDDLSDTDPVPNPGYLMPEPYFSDRISRSPSPLPSPAHLFEPPSSDLWDKRYEIHDEAFSTLYAALVALHGVIDPTNSRLVLMPLYILALVTRPLSKERALCLAYLAKFESSTASSTPTPTHTATFSVNIPWENLDAYSEATERLRRDSAVGAEIQMAQSAPEWSWWDMLKHIDMDNWLVTCGTANLERGSESWAFGLMSTVVDEECLSYWLQGPASSRASTSST